MYRFLQERSLDTMAQCRIIVTGGAGFIGSAVVRHLINDNEKSPFEFIPGMLQYRNTNAAKALLQAIPGGIVLGSWQLAELVKNKKSTYKLLSINGISPSAENINSGKYPLTANHILLWSSSNPPSRLNVLIKFLHSSALRSGHLIPAPEAENF